MPTAIKAHKFEREKNDHYVDERWCAERLFQVEKFEGPILDPCAGWGRIVSSAIRAGHNAYGSDIVDRRPDAPDGELVFQRDYFRVYDFLALGNDEIFNWWRQANSIVGNPPFALFEQFVGRALSMMFKFRDGGDKVAFIWQSRRLNAAHWLRAMPLAKIYYLTPRPSMPTSEFIHKVLRGETDPETGEKLKIGGGTQDYVWLIFEKGHVGKPQVDWLHRDGD
jgi:hypothetical protein